MMEEEEQQGPVVTALIVSRNCASALRRCLASLDQSDNRDTLEVLVVDNGSTDGSPALDSEFPRVHFMRLPKNFGRTKALNIGMRTAKGTFILFLPPDSVVPPGAIPAMTQVLEADPSIGAVCSWTGYSYRLPDAASLGSEWKTGQLPGRQELSEGSEPVPVDYPRDAPLLVRRQQIAGMNYLDHRYGEHWSDADLCRQIRTIGKKILMLPGVRIERSAEESPTHSDAVSSADSAIGAAAYLGKQAGFKTALAFRFGAVLYSLGRLVTLRQPGYEMKRFGALLTGQKIDGTQE